MNSPGRPSYPVGMLLVVVFGWASLQAARFLLPPLLPRITATLGLSPGGVGLALTAFGLVYAAVQYPSGTYSDTLSRATLVVPGLLVLLAGVAVVAVAVTPLLFLVGVVVLGADIGAARAVFLGASALGPGVVGLVAELTTFETAFWLLVGCFLTCALVLVRQHRR